MTEFFYIWFYSKHLIINKNQETETTNYFFYKSRIFKISNKKKRNHFLKINKKMKILLWIIFLKTVVRSEQEPKYLFYEQEYSFDKLDEERFSNYLIIENLSILQRFDLANLANILGTSILEPGTLPAIEFNFDLYLNSILTIDLYELYPIINSIDTVTIFIKNLKKLFSKIFRS